MKVAEIKCDWCGKIAPQVKDKWGQKCSIPLKWFNLDRLDMDYNKSLFRKNYMRLRINENTDPDFCSEKCAIAWFTKQLRKLKKKLRN